MSKGEKFRILLAGAIVPAIALCAPGAALAEESQFAYVYTTDLLPKGAKEVEQWMTWRHGRSQGDFDVWEGRTEVEYGVTDKFQAAFYANYATTRTFHNNVDGTTVPPESFAEAFPGADEHYRDSKFVGLGRRHLPGHEPVYGSSRPGHLS